MWEHFLNVCQVTIYVSNYSNYDSIECISTHVAVQNMGYLTEIEDSKLKPFSTTSVGVIDEKMLTEMI